MVGSTQVPRSVITQLLSGFLFRSCICHELTNQVLITQFTTKKKKRQLVETVSARPCAKVYPRTPLPVNTHGSCYLRLEQEWLYCADVAAPSVLREYKISQCVTRRVTEAARPEHNGKKGRLPSRACASNAAINTRLRTDTAQDKATRW